MGAGARRTVHVAHHVLRRMARVELVRVPAAYEACCMLQPACNVPCCTGRVGGTPPVRQRLSSALDPKMGLRGSQCDEPQCAKTAKGNIR
jgi:hypothetical protein